MKKHMPIYVVCLSFVFLASCKEKVTATPENSTNQGESGLPHTASTITDFNVITAPNAPSRITRKIKQDNEGNLLMAAYEDIIRYDGKSFTKFEKQKELDSWDAFDIMEDKKGNIWIVSTHMGVFLFAPITNLKTGGKAFTHFTVENGLANNRSMCIYEDKAGGIWIGTEGGISYYDGKANPSGQVGFRNFSKNDGLTNSDINTIMEDKTGKIWVGTRGTLCVYDPSKSAFVEIRDNEGKSYNNVWSIIEDKKGNIWLAGEQGLWHFNGHLFTNYIKADVTGVYEDEKGNLWFTHGTNDPHKAGFSVCYEKSLNKGNPSATQIHIGDGMFFGISEDKDGNIWVGSLKGVFRYNGNSVTYFESNETNEP